MGTTSASAGQRGAAFFDLDKTVIAKASLAAFSPTLRRAGLLSWWLVLRALWGQVLFRHLGADEERMAQVRESALRVATGWDQAHVRRLVHDALAEVVDPIVYEEALELIAEHRAAGRPVYVVSAAPEEIVVPLAGYLGVDDAIASRGRVDPVGRYTGEVEFYCQGPAKAEALAVVAERDAIDLDASYAYSDSVTDLPMLEAVGHPVAVNPDRPLARIATERGWPVRRFRHRVSIRDRLATAGPAHWAAGSTLTALAVVALAAWVLTRRRFRSGGRG